RLEGSRAAGYSNGKIIEKDQEVDDDQADVGPGHNRLCVVSVSRVVWDHESSVILPRRASRALMIDSSTRQAGRGCASGLWRPWRLIGTASSRSPAGCVVAVL